jgi:hypothetical protein
MSMRDEDVIARNLVHIDVFRQSIRCYEWVKKQMNAIDFNTKSAMSVVGISHLDGYESIVKQGVSRFHDRQSCTHTVCEFSVDKSFARAEY